MPTPRKTDFAKHLAWSEGALLRTTSETIQSLLGTESCVAVNYVTDRCDQRAGIDYRAVLRGGAPVDIDHKARRPGASRFWGGSEPQFALEHWSLVPGTSPSAPRGATGWTLDESKRTDYILFTYDPADTDRVFLVPFQLLRIAFRRNFACWSDGRFKVGRESTVDRQRGTRWESECVFVPASVAFDAITRVMRGVA
jgi:hypothetical protein